MASLSADRPSEVVLAARVARQYYLEGASKIDINEVIVTALAEGGGDALTFTDSEVLRM